MPVAKVASSQFVWDPHSAGPWGAIVGCCSPVDQGPKMNPSVCLGVARDASCLFGITLPNGMDYAVMSCSFPILGFVSFLIE